MIVRPGVLASSVLAGRRISGGDVETGRGRSRPWRSVTFVSPVSVVEDRGTTDEISTYQTRIDSMELRPFWTYSTPHRSIAEKAACHARVAFRQSSEAAIEPEIKLGWRQMDSGRTGWAWNLDDTGRGGDRSLGAVVLYVWRWARPEFAHAVVVDSSSCFVRPGGAKGETCRLVSSPLFVQERGRARPIRIASSGLDFVPRRRTASLYTRPFGSIGPQFVGQAEFVHGREGERGGRRGGGKSKRRSTSTRSSPLTLREARARRAGESEFGFGEAKEKIPGAVPFRLPISSRFGFWAALVNPVPESAIIHPPGDLRRGSWAVVPAPLSPPSPFYAAVSSPGDLEPTVDRSLNFPRRTFPTFDFLHSEACVLGGHFTMKPNQLILSNLDIDRGVYKFSPELPVSHDLGLSLFSHAGTVVGTSLRHHRKICSSGNVMVHGAFNRLNKLSRALFFWLSRPTDPKIFRWLSAIAASGSRSYQLHMKQASSHMQNLTRLQFGFLVREEQAIQLLLARLANATAGRLCNDFEKQGACNLLTLAGAAAIVPPLENISPIMLAPIMLAEAITLRNTDDYISRPADQPCVEGKCLRCASPSVPSTIFKEDAVEPKTGIKFPPFLEDDSSPSATVLVGIGFKGMRIMRVKNLNLYAFGLYMQPNSIREKLGPKYASVPTDKLMENPDFYKDLLRENLHMRVRLIVNYNGLSVGAVRDVFEKSLGLRLQKMNPNTDYHCLKTFGSHFTEDIPIPVGTKIDFCQTSDGKLITEIDGRQIGAVQSKDLCKAFFDMYIGDSPVSLEAKKVVAQNVAGLIARR